MVDTLPPHGQIMRPLAGFHAERSTSLTADQEQSSQEPYLLVNIEGVQKLYRLGTETVSEDFFMCA